MYIDATHFGFTRLLEAHWRTIRAEVDALGAGNFMAWPETGLYDSGWSVFGLFLAGHPLPSHAALCPETVQLLGQVPGLRTAGFSLLAPGTRILPHQGISTSVLRCHLGLHVPAGDCALRVVDDVRRWQAGRCLVFDDTSEHEAWNNSPEPRVVLLLDFLRRPDLPPDPPTGWEALVLERMMLGA